MWGRVVCSAVSALMTYWTYVTPTNTPPALLLTSAFPSTPDTVADTMDTHNIQIDQNLSSLDIFNTPLSGQLFFRFP